MIRIVKIIISTIRNRKNAWKYLWGHFLVKTNLNRFLTISMNGYKLNFTNSAMAISLFADKNDRNNDEIFLRKVLSIGDTFIDVGANIGTLSIPASILVSNSGQVVSIEAHPETFKCLKSNVKLNEITNLKAIHSAAGDKQGKLTFSNINSDDENKVLLKNENGIEVSVTTLDKMIKEYASISLLKIDVEGYEKYVFEGAIQTLKKTKLIYYESWERHFDNYSYETKDVIEFLNNHDFLVFGTKNDKIWHVGANHVSENCENLIALKEVDSFCTNFGFELIETQS